ncbi:Metallo-dependent phosphatase [Lentinus tigrinus ALCF2SS1-7]|uniref:Metallo-dependent phosphatase n=1 Tax=Lentinus tigrinus ALCF2SS1-6 TaxID=1328759 RepID=A0A5C2S7W4_9APHY|nr:Metallo-dependent phosphatase [Lentinus tigrinus ALCF2SS1-6]RPD74687.1 Metallo-dependent phosphatase [Lentinus tigrinus ALCF2SS1-7]
MRRTATSYRPSKSSTTVVLVFVLAVLALACLNEPMLVSRVQHVSLTSLATLKKKKPKFPFPDFNRYIHTQTLTPKEFGLNAPDERVIIVGDTHGMNGSLHNLLSTVQYNPHKDTLFLVGDILAKSTEAGSLAILDFLSQHRQGHCYVHASADASPDPISSIPAEKQKACKNLYAVRGNHDQMIVQWRAWREWFEDLQLILPSAQSYPRRIPPLASLNSIVPHTSSASYDAGPPVGTGSQFLALIESEWLRDRTNDPSGAGADAQEWADTMRKRAVGTWREEWWRRIPQPGKGRASKDFVMLGDHYWIARDMKPEHAEFLFSLPLVIHVPSEHFFLVHAGLLPSDPRHPANDERQPLAHPPLPGDDDDDVPRNGDEDYGYPILDASSTQEVFPRLASLDLDDEVEELRVLQERALIQDVPHNRDPWVVLNIRGIRKRGKVTRRSDKGTPWAKIWNGQMKRCGGFKNATAPADSYTDEDEEDSRDKHGDAEPLPCYPSTVVYGHAASRDLDIRRWTVGLDTGCLYGRRLTALVLTHPRHAHEKHAPSHTVPSDAEDDDEDESSEEEEDEELLGDEYAYESEDPFEGVNDQFARVGGGSVVSRSRKPRSWTRKIRFGDKDSDLAAKLVSIKCPKVADLS